MKLCYIFMIVALYDHFASAQSKIPDISGNQSRTSDRGCTSNRGDTSDQGSTSNRGGIAYQGSTPSQGCTSNQDRTSNQDCTSNQGSTSNQDSDINTNCKAPVQNFFVTGSCINEAAPDIPCDYTLVPGVGALKLHLESKTWNEARKICFEEGGHLATITSPAENDLINLWRLKHGLIGNQHGVWLGFHNLYNNKDIECHAMHPFVCKIRSSATKKTCKCPS